MSFSTIPILDLSLAQDPASKPAFLESLREALLDVGFLYITGTGIDSKLIGNVIGQGKAFFELPEANKLELQMKNQPSFLGKYIRPFSICSSQSKQGTDSCDIFKATTNSETRSQLFVPTGANRSTFPPRILFPILTLPYTTISSLQTNGLRHPICPLFGLHTRHTYLLWPPSPEALLL